MKTVQHKKWNMEIVQHEMRSIGRERFKNEKCSSLKKLWHGKSFIKKEQIVKEAHHENMQQKKVQYENSGTWEKHKL